MSSKYKVLGCLNPTECAEPIEAPPPLCEVYNVCISSEKSGMGKLQLYGSRQNNEATCATARSFSSTSVGDVDLFFIQHILYPRSPRPFNFTANMPTALTLIAQAYMKNHLGHDDEP